MSSKIEQIDRKRFESKIQKTAGCHWWTGTVEKESNRALYSGRKAATIAWEFGSGEKLETGMVIKMTCGNLLCVRFDHLELARRTFGWLV